MNSSLHRPFTSVLIANRGEIAVRIVREAKAMGLRAIAVYSDADKHALHVEDADVAVHIGPSPARDSYLNVERILAAAKQTNAEAIHPGYGFLSENPDFAQAVIDAGLVWIGPSPDAIRAMGDKGNAKDIARKANVPVIPGYEGDDQSSTRLLAEAKKIGWPVLIKAALGGGGRGQRRVAQESDFADALAGAKREALSAFASDRMILEKALDNVRHVEVQIFGDTRGNVIHLGERDCSIQRRNQKIVEEAPAPGVTDELRRAMGDAAVRLAKAVNYTNAGTVEYLLDRESKFYFLEMNTRIQVEHPVTEEVTGTNLIQWQFTVARGDTLPLEQISVKIAGHAIEARLCAEDPADGFRPQMGEALFYNPEDYTKPTNCRVDSGVGPIASISSHYDPMLAKVIATGTTRRAALERLVEGLSRFDVRGIRTNRDYLIELLGTDGLTTGMVDIGWLERQPKFQDSHIEGLLGRVAALYLAHGEGNGWRSTGTARSTIRLRERNIEQTHVVEGGTTKDVSLVEAHTSRLGEWGSVVVATREKRLRARTLRRDTFLQVEIVGQQGSALFEDITYAPAEPRGMAGANIVRAPMAGRIVKVLAEPGAKVEKNQLLVILEAMKMEHELRAGVMGTVESVSVKPGDQVAIRQTLVTLSPN
jgi:geranyl-CoA carboxylase alpha subunit